jgi:plasmid stabilization system protein ParE
VKLRYTLPALADLEKILGYIESHSPQGAARVKSRIQTMINLLLQQPLIGTRTDDPAIRRMMISPYPYLVFYEAAGKELIIHAVRHASRKPASMPGSGEQEGG